MAAQFLASTCCGHQSELFNPSTSFLPTYAFAAASISIRISPRKLGGAEHILETRIHSTSGDPKLIEEDDIMTDILVLESNCLQLKGVVNFSNRGIGPDMRDRVNRLYDRLSLLKQSAERAVRTNGRASAQLIATFKGLQREQSSLENIVRLATEAGPVITGLESNSALKSSLTTTDVTSTSLSKEEGITRLTDETTKIELFQRLQRESTVKVADVPKYAMTAPASEDSSSVAALRAEIERRVMEQLAAKKVGHPTVSIQTKTWGSTILQAEDQRRQKPQKVESATTMMEQADLDGKGGADTLSQDSLQRIMKTGHTDASFKTLELDRLKSQLGGLQKTFKDLEMNSSKAELGQANSRKLESENEGNIPIELHDQVVSRVKEALFEARAHVARITGEVREKEAMLTAVKGELMAEQQKLYDKVKELTNEIGRRVTIEEMNDAISKTLTEVENDLKSAQNHARSLGLELEKKERMIVQLQEDWKTDTKGLHSEIVYIKDSLSVMQKAWEDFGTQNLQFELTGVKDKLVIMENERKHEQAKLFEAQENIRLLEGKLRDLTQKLDNAEASRESLRQDMLDNVRTLVTEMVSDSQIKSTNESKNAYVSQIVGVTERDEQDFKKKVNEVSNTILDSEPSLSRVLQESGIHEGVQLSDERAASLENFFAVMGHLIRQEIERMNASSEKNSLLSSGTRKDGQDQVLQTEKMITLLYASSWERTFVHYSADNAGWTKVPGVLMQSENQMKGRSWKVLKIQARRLEFVLTDGEGNWDRDPSGSNYIINEPGSFVLSAGVLREAC